MPAERLWFGHTIDGLFVRGLGARLTPELKEKLRTAGIDLNKPQPAWPIEAVHAGCVAILPTLYPKLELDAAFRQLGISFMQGYAETFIGTAMVQVMKVIGPRRTLERMQKNFRSGGNFVETRFASTGPTARELWINDVSPHPEFYVGLIEEGGRMIGTKNLRVAITKSEPPALTVNVTWTA